MVGGESANGVSCVVVVDDEDDGLGSGMVVLFFYIFWLFIFHTLQFLSTNTKRPLEVSVLIHDPMICNLHKFNTTFLFYS